MTNQKNDPKSSYVRSVATLIVVLVLIQSHDVSAYRAVGDSTSIAYNQEQTLLPSAGGAPIEIAPHFLRRIQRSASDQQASLADMLNIPRSKPTREYQYETRKQLNNQLSELLNRAANDKSFEKALLNALIQQQQQLVDQNPSITRDSVILNNANQLQDDPQLASYRQADLVNMAAKLAAFSDQANLNANDISINELGAGDYATAGDGSQLPNKRSMLPCNFNAVSCAKNPFRRV